MQACKPSTPEDMEKHNKVVLFCLSEDKKIPWEACQEILVGDVGQAGDNSVPSLSMLLNEDCCYALHDTT